MSDIAIDGLSVVFPDGAVGLEDINLRVNSGEFVALVGPSGSGKTTLLRTLAGFLQPSTGTVSLDGKDVTRTPPEKRRMGMVFQQHAVWPHMSVADNVAYPLKRSGASKKEQQQLVESTLRTVGLESHGGRKPSTLSGGQRQRVALARAIVAKPQVLLLDEALSALDEPLRDSLRRELVALTKQSSLTTVHVTHDRKEAIAIADRIALLRDGRIEQFASARDIVAQPASPWVAAFIADATLLEGQVIDDRVVVDTPSMEWPLTQVEMVGEVGQRGYVTVAVLPETVEVVPPGELHVQNGRITSSLFEVSGYSLAIDVDGVEFRARTSARTAAEVGETVGVKVHAPLVYTA